MKQNFPLPFPYDLYLKEAKGLAKGSFSSWDASQKCCRQETPCKPQGFNGWVQQPAMVAHILESQPDTMGRLMKTNTASNTSSPKGRKESRI